MATVQQALSLGWQQQQAGRLDEAERNYRLALNADPGNAGGWCFLGMVLHDRQRFDEAVAAYDEAVRRQPDFAIAFNNLGNSLTSLGRFEEAQASFRQALRLKPDYANAHNSLGHTLYRLGRLHDAVASFEDALRLNPQHPQAHRNLGLALLQLGDFARGWPEYEWRWKCPEFPMRQFPRPPWDGRPLDGQTILLHAEQGMGDAIQFVRYAPLVKQRGGQVVVECHEPLVRLLRGCAGVDQAIAKGATPPAFDCHAPLLSLPGIFRTSLADLPATVPYLTADADRIRHWREQFSSLPGTRIGIVWQGNPGYFSDRERSAPLAAFAPLAAVPGVTLVSLQKGLGSEQVASCSGQFPIADFGALVGDFWDTAAAMANLELIVSVDTSAGHLAGALGRPVWLALSHNADWRWLVDRADTPWYATMRLFRQPRAGDWGSVFSAVAATLERTLIATRNPGCSATPGL